MARPMIVEITTRLENPQGFDKIDDMQRRMKTFRPIFDDMRSDLEEAWSKNFDTEGGHYGGWRPLSPKYALWRGSSGPILNRSGRLFNSVRSLHGAPNDIKDDEAFFGTNVEYAKFHQYGTNKMPKRPIIFEPNDAARKWGGWAAKYIADGETFGIKG